MIYNFSFIFKHLLRKQLSCNIKYTILYIIQYTCRSIYKLTLKLHISSINGRLQGCRTPKPKMFILQLKNVSITEKSYLTQLKIICLHQNVEAIVSFSLYEFISKKCVIFIRHKQIQFIYICIICSIIIQYYSYFYVISSLLLNTL